MRIRKAKSATKEEHNSHNMMNDNRKKLRFDDGAKERLDPAIPTKIQVRKDVSNDAVLEQSENASEKRDAAALLLAVAAIASKEIRVDGLVWDDDDEHSLVRPKATFAKMSVLDDETWEPSNLAPRFAFANSLGNDSDQYDDMEDLTLPPTDDRFAWSRVRAVSMDSEGIRASPDSHHRKAISNIVSPESSPVVRRTPAPRKRGLRRKKRKRSYSADSSGSSPAGKKTLPNDKHKGRVMTKILRKKFSWKNYPEVSYCTQKSCIGLI